MKNVKKAHKMNAVVSALEKLTDEELSSLQFSMPWQVDAEQTVSSKDADGFPLEHPATAENREYLQSVCWDKFNKSPFVGPAIRGQVGRLTGLGFEISSDVPEIHEVIEETEYDPRNRLFMNWPKYVGRGLIEGELFQILTVHENGFVEVDFVDPSHIKGGGEDGVLYHPTKAIFPLFYFVAISGEDSVGSALVPSINIAYFPELIELAKKDKSYVESQTAQARNSKAKFKGLGGFQRFIVAWDRSFMTRRNVSYLRTVLEWLNHYENLKKYEIDHKKSAGAYLWVITIEDPKSFRTWLALSDEERRKTGVMAKKTPGSTLILPPGMKAEAINPRLPTISESDTDILHMVTGGLNEPEDISTGQSKGTFASVKASRGPMSDRISDEIAYFDRFLKFEFYKAVFFLKHKVSGFPDKFSSKEAVDFRNQKPVFKRVSKSPEFLVDVSYPVSEVNDAETRARAYLGVKHGSVFDVLGIPNEEVAKKLGFGNYRRLRLKQATEEERFPELLPPVDSGGEQLEPGVRKAQAKAPEKNKNKSEE